jgi:glycolate oxidase iron-sulfur subunit
MGMLAATKTRGLPTGLASGADHSWTSAERPTATLFRGCVMDDLFSHVHDATARTLAANGIGTVDAPGQTCCGALHAHTGDHDAAMRLARQNVTAFSALPEQTIVVNAAGCGAMLKEYGELLSGHALAPAARAMAGRVRDISEVLAECGPRPGARLDVRIAYDPPCHLLHAQRVEEPPLRMFDAVPGLARIDHADAEMCCGSAGSYALTEPGLSRTVLARKIETLARVQPDLVVSGNPGCVMQIGAGLRAAGLDLPVVHPVEVLDWSYRKAGYYDGD